MQDDSDPVVSRSEEKQPKDSFLPVTIPQFCAYFTGRKIADTMESAKEKTRTGEPQGGKHHEKSTYHQRKQAS